MSLKAKVEAIIYAAEEPITLEQISQLLREVVLADLAAAKENDAIEQADSAAEAIAASANAANPAEAADATLAETALLPELAPDLEEPICPEAGPLMPQEATPEDGARSDSLEEKNANEGVREADDQAGEIFEQTRVEENGDEEDVQQPAVENPLPEAASEHMVSESAAESDPVNAELAAAASASVSAPETASRKRQSKKSEQEIAEDKAVRARVRQILVELVTDYASEERGIEIRQVAGGFRMATKPEHHDVVRAFAKSLKPPIRLSLAALETLAVIAYKQPITGPEIADIRGVESAGVLGTLLDRKLITTAGRKQVIGRPMQYKTSKDFLLRFGLNDVNELPSMEEFSLLASDGTIEIAPPEAQLAPSLFEPSSTAAAMLSAESTATQDATLEVPQDVMPEPEEPSVEPGKLEAHDQGAQLSETQEVAELQQPDAADAADSQPQSDAESNNVPEAEHPIGH
jgi:segregation and condensation protein B